MAALDKLKELLKGRNTSNINAHIAKNPNILDKIDEAGNSGLMYIAYHQLPDSLAFAIDKKKDFTLHEAAAMGLWHKVISKVNAYPNHLNEPAKDGFYPLTLACFFGHFKIADYLIKKGAKVNLPATNPTKVMPLHSAVARNDFKLCKLLIENGAEVNARQTQGVTALHSAAHRGNLEIVTLLVSNGADISMQTDDGKTALSFAEQDEKEAVVAFLKR